MNSLVSLQSAGMSETPPAVSTRVRFLSSVGPLVLFQEGDGGEHISTLGAHVSFHTGVYFLVLLQIFRHGKSLPAKRAQVRPFIRVDFQVPF